MSSSTAAQRSDAKMSGPKKHKAPPFREVLRLMRMECDRAQRHGYPITLMLITPDGFDEGPTAKLKRKLMPAVFHELKKTAFEHDAQGLGGFTEDVQIAVFPHYAPDKMNDLAQDLMARVGKLKAPEGMEKISMSIGVSHNQHEGPMSFEILVQEAETGLGMAQKAGGDRCVQWLEVETELDRLRDELDAQLDEMRQSSEILAEEQDTLGEKWGNELIKKTLGIFEAEPEQSEGILRIKKEMIAMLHEAIDGWKESSLIQELNERTKRAEQLERRVTKLGHLLEVTEGELKRVAAMKSVDLGVASIYRTVQGLSSEDDNAELKKEMMKSIFEANLEIQGKSAT